MKKILLSLFFVLTFSIISFAQLGFRAGINFADQSYESISTGSGIEASSIVGYMIGVNYKVNLNSLIAVRPGIQFELKGSSTIVNGQDIASKFNYIELPIDVVFSLGDLSFHGGPYLAYLNSAKAMDLNLKDNFKSIDIGLNIGLGFNIGNFGIGASYGLGLSDISDYPVGGAIKNNVLSLFLTYTL